MNKYVNELVGKKINEWKIYLWKILSGILIRAYSDNNPRRKPT